MFVYRRDCSQFTVHFTYRNKYLVHILGTNLQKYVTIQKLVEVELELSLEVEVKYHYLHVGFGSGRYSYSSII